MEENLVKDESNPAPVQHPAVRGKRVASVYDVVAGRMGLSGFLTAEQQRNPNLLPCTPEEVLLRRIGAPDEIPYDYYDADEKLKDGQNLPNSDLLKAIHTYASDFYAANKQDAGPINFRSFDETALLALGILLEEASKEALGDTGDMAFTEHDGSHHEPAASKMANHQIIGRVVPRRLHRTNLTEDATEDDLAIEQSPRKKQK